jgi:membrane protease subunit HflC
MYNSKNKLVIILVLAAAAVMTIFSSAFVIPEGRQAVITQFGKPIKSVREAGLHFKSPFVQDVRMIDLRILSWDGNPNQIPTKDKKYIEVDTTARWKIKDPLKFIQTVQNENGARTRLDAILDGITRDVISSHNLVEAVRNSNNIIETIKERSAQYKEDRAKQKADAVIVEEEITGEIELVDIGREKLSQLIIEPARSELESLGIQLIDVQFKRISYEKSVQDKVYARMISERERIAGRIRSYGKGEKAKIEGKTQKDLNQIQSEAYRKVQAIRGQAEGKAIAIYAKALNQDFDFYRFSRSLEAYDKALPSEAKLLLSSKSKFWKVLKRGQAH